MSEYRIKKVDVVSTVAAVLIAGLLLIFPFINPCEAEDSTVCTWNADTRGNGEGHSFTNYYGVSIYHPWSFTE